MNQATIKGIQKKKSLRSHLMILVSIAILPTLIFIGILLGVMTYQQVKNLDLGLKGTTRALSASIDNKISTIVSSLQVLLVTEDFESADYKALHKKLQRTIKSQEGWKAISLAKPDGQQLFNTFVPYGSKLPSYANEPFFQKAVEAKKLSVSSFRKGLVTGQPNISIAIPVKSQSNVTYVLVGTVELSSLSKSLKEQNLPSSWISSIIDETGTILARNKSDEIYTGQKATNVLAQELKKTDDDIFEDVNKEGVQSRGAFYKSKYTGWTIVIGLPLKEMYGPIWDNILSISIGAIFLLSIGIFLAYIYGNRIARPILALSQSAPRSDEGPVDSEIREIAEVAMTLKAEGEKAHDAIAIRDTFLSVASHELKTPITSLQLQFQMLTRHLRSMGVENEKTNHSINKISGQMKRITKLIDDLLNVTKISAGKLDLQYETIHLNELVQDIASQFETENITLASKDSITGHWDQSRLEQIITNLTSNAIKYGDGNPISIQLSQDKEFAYIAVKDQGIGIKAEDQQRIFDQFERVQGNHGISGLGMGLWITLKIINGMDGDIQVESSEGAGSVFTVKLPLERKDNSIKPIF